VNAAAKDAELYLRRCRKLEDVIADLLAALETVTKELSRWGFGDHHYGDQPQEASVREAVEAGSTAIAKARTEL